MKRIWMFVAALTLGTACGGGGGADNPVAPVDVPPAVASVTVVLSSTQIVAGTGTTASAELRAANGAALSGRSVTWSSSSPSVATVDGGGVITAVSAGPTIISATSEGKTGTALLEVRSAIASVTLLGANRVKVGDSYQYSVTARASDGSTVTRPVAWGTANPGAGSFTPEGLFTPASAGPITIVTTIDGAAWEATVTAYDWVSLSTSGSLFVTLPSDNQITTQYGSSEYPELTFACSSTGSFVAWVSTERFVTANGIVAFSFDGSTPIVQTWLEFNSFSALGKTGTNASVKSFAIQVAGARHFAFAFGEFRGSTHGVSFRVTGLAPRLTPLLNACPGNSMQSAVSDALSAMASMQSSMQLPSPELVQLRRERAKARASTQVPSLGAGGAAVQVGELRTTRRKQ